MTDHPTPFTGAMVRALLAGTKTQTRRRIVPYGAMSGQGAAPKNLIQVKVPARLGGFIAGPTFNPCYAVGDRLWVRESWRADKQLDAIAPREMSYGEPIRYDADGAMRQTGCVMIDAGEPRPSRFMPRWASRLTLTVTDVRVERLQDISEEDARAEGIRVYEDAPGSGDAECLLGWDEKDIYRQLWEHINGPGSWDANPWVTAISFDIHRCNIDEMARTVLEAPNDR